MASRKQTRKFITLGLKLQHGKGKEGPKCEMVKLRPLEMSAESVSIREKFHRLVPNPLQVCTWQGGLITSLLMAPARSSVVLQDTLRRGLGPTVG